MSKSKTKYCPETGKQMFDRRSQAEKVAYGTKKRLRCTRVGSVYLCQHCGKYHVTHYSYEASRDFRTMDKKRVLRYVMEYRYEMDIQPKKVHRVLGQIPCTFKTRLS